MQPFRIRRRARLRLSCSHGARLTRADQEKQEDAASRGTLGEQSRSHSRVLYFDLLTDDDEEDYISERSGPSYNEFFVDAILAGPAFLDHLGHGHVRSYNQKDSEAYEASQNDKDADLGESAGIPVQSVQDYEESYEKNSIALEQDLGEPAGTPVQSVQDSEESCPSDNEKNTIALEQKQRQLDIGEEISDQELLDFMAQLPPTYYMNSKLQLDPHQQIMLYERHALYRIRACKLLQQKFICQLVDYADLKRRYTPEYLADKGYFMRYEEDGTFSWFFHPAHCELACLDDYQRLVLLNDGGYEYKDWDAYCSSYHTQEIDQEYVKYYHTFSSQVEWIKEYLGLYSTCPEKWWKIRERAFRQAMKIATGFSKISVHLVRLAFREYASSITFDFYHLKDLDGVYFEIWKRVTKQKKSFHVALKEVYQLNKFPLHQGRLKHAIKIDSTYCEQEFRCFTAGITGKFAEDKALKSIAQEIEFMYKKPKGYEQYASKKLRTAELLGLISVA